jgi:protein-tyrosine phosphatase
VVTPVPASGIAGRRVVPLEGGVNFRDLGGYPTVDGGRVRWGLAFRSGALHRLTAADVAILSRLGLRVVYDLRTDPECDLAPSVLLDGVRFERLAIGGDAARTRELTAPVLEGRPADIASDFLERLYPAMAEAAAPSFGRLLTRLAEPGGLPALFHCAAGKDRTGLSAVLLLSVLGVDEAAILDDYQLSAELYTARQMDKVRLKLGASGVDLEGYHNVYGAPRHAMATLLATLRERHGGVETFLEDEAGVDPQVFTELRARLVEPSAPGASRELAAPH